MTWNKIQCLRKGVTSTTKRRNEKENKQKSSINEQTAVCNVALLVLF